MVSRCLDLSRFHHLATAASLGFLELVVAIFVVVVIVAVVVGVVGVAGAVRTLVGAVSMLVGVVAAVKDDAVLPRR